MRKYFLGLFWVLSINLLGASLAFAQAYLYTNNNTVSPGNTISGFKVAANGTLTPLPGFPVDTGGGGSPGMPSEGTAIAVAGSWLYATNVGSLSISAFRINHDGSLTLLQGPPVATGSIGVPVTLAVHPSGKFLVCGNHNFDISVFRINADSTLTPVAGSPFPSSSDPYSTAFTPNGNFLFIGGDSGTTISVYSFNATTGSLTQVAGSPFPAGGGAPLGYCVSPDGSKLFSALGIPNQLGVYNINPTTGGLTPIPGSPFASGMSGFLVDSVRNGSGTRLFVVGRTGPNDIGVYNIAGDGTPTPAAGSPFQSGGTTAEVVAINNTGSLLFVANGDSRTVSVFSINAATGALTAVPGSPFATGATSGFIGGMSFALAPPAPVVPTMNAWGAMILIVLLGIGSVYFLKRPSPVDTDGVVV
jgi:6-phosphogluconolactonase (cycloisomerase 2 family)